jgi:hypothetical protein
VAYSSQHTSPETPSGLLTITSYSRYNRSWIENSADLGLLSFFSLIVDDGAVVSGTACRTHMGAALEPYYRHAHIFDYVD